MQICDWCLCTEFTNQSGFSMKGRIMSCINLIFIRKYNFSIFYQNRSKRLISMFYGKLWKTIKDASSGFLGLLRSLTISELYSKDSFIINISFHNYYLKSNSIILHSLILLFSVNFNHIISTEKPRKPFGLRDPLTLIILSRICENVKKFFFY